MRRTLGIIGAVAAAGVAAWLLTGSPLHAQLGSASPVASTVSVGTTTVQLLAANGSRHGIIIYNQSTNVISVTPGTAAAVASGGGTINIAASGGMLSMSCNVNYPCGNAWQAIRVRREQCRFDLGILMRYNLNDRPTPGGSFEPRLNPKIVKHAAQRQARAVTAAHMGNRWPEHGTHRR